MRKLSIVSVIICLFSIPTLLSAQSPTKEEVFGIPKIKRQIGSPSVAEEYQDFKTENTFAKTRMVTSNSSGGRGLITPKKRVYGVRPRCRKCPYS